MSAPAGHAATSQVEKLLRVVRENGASEMRLSADAAPMLLINGSMRPLKSRPLTEAEVSGLTAAVMPPAADPGSFSFESSHGVCSGAVLDNDGTKVLILRPGNRTQSVGAIPPPPGRVPPPGGVAPPPGGVAPPPGGGRRPPGPSSPADNLELDLGHDEPAPADDGDAEVSFDMPKAADGTIQIDKLLMAAVKGGVSDIHITTGLPPVFRVDGAMRPQKTKVLTGDDTNALMKAITPERCQAELAEKGGADFGFAFKDLARFRVSVFKQRGQVAMVLRQIPNKLLTPEQLGVPEICKKLVTRPRGLFLVTGPTGSGKSTTLAGLIDYINDNFDHHIITVEDPIEFYHYSKKSTVNQREVGTDVPSFSEALRRALRQDPDVILVGELRDLETIEAAISAAETGHVVFGTLHTTGAQGTVNRIIDAFPTNQQEQIRTQLSTAILGVLSQTLLPKIGGGRCAAYEVLVVDSGIGNLIRENKTFRINSAIQTGAKKGMRLLDDDLFRLWSERKVTEEDVLAKAQNYDELFSRISNAKQGLFDDDETVTRRGKKED
jgi:twitching motility protein PilT